MRRSVLGSVLCCALGACSVSNTGNPHTMSGDTTPEGITLLRSELTRDTAPAVSDSELLQLGKDQRKFTFALYDVLAKDNPNLFFSPYSISTALAMLYAGAKAETKSEMASALSFTLPDSALHAAFNAADLALDKRASEIPSDGKGDGFALNTTNATFVQRGLDVRDEYLDVLAKHYDAGLFLADFKSDPERERRAINRWVLDLTAQRIDELLPPSSITSLTALVLVNTIHFKGSWKTKFKVENTADAVFHAPSGDKSVQMMHDTMKWYMRGDGYQAVSLPYVSESVQMLLILPDEGKQADVEQRLKSGLFDEATNGLEQRTVDLRLPRFEFGAKFDLKGALQTLGMKRAFGEDGPADLSGIAGEPGGLVVTGAFHQAFVAVDESGTEAAAATAVVIGERGAPQPVSIIFDRPFLFAVYDEPTGQILFAGRLSEP